ncbi:MAG: TerC family protein [Flavobacteriaceae bacterium]|nr:TerC family protein [Flavobacteriaceae bacterium]MDO7580814.1 TerC family protein [Flavobacteriaceae bacterium]MDO7599736.1 TerC family protein [Flavobacteriaceae bacterium]MDO7615256.1 TerC family protein [Flavobacteriaceae bacterium]MDO7703109.1 TerC family protein [Flavobacteriaceae bacterium]
MEQFFTSEAISALLTLTFLEIVLGIDNILFISIITQKLDDKQQKLASNIGLFLAMLLRIVLLFGISFVIQMQSSLLIIDNSWIQSNINGQAIILFLGGIFLLYKSTHEIFEKIEADVSLESEKPVKLSLSKAIVQITLLNIVFSFDSILTAVGMTNGIQNALPIMVIAIIVSVGIMMIFMKPVSSFIQKHPSLQILGLSFLILIGFMLITESAHLSETVIFDNEVGAIPKGYLYFAISFSLGIEFLNMKIKTRKNKLKL